MKKLLLSIALFTTMFVSAQNTQPVTRADINQINLYLNDIDRFGRQHRTGNHLIIAGTLIAGIGSAIVYNNLVTKYNGWTSNSSYNLGLTAIGIGSGLTATGLVINIDSFRHLRNNW